MPLTVQHALLTPHWGHGQALQPGGAKYVVHDPATHTWSTLHAWPQMPQFSGSVLRAAIGRQPPLQNTLCEGHDPTHAPPEHAVAPWQAFVQVPQ